MESYGKVFKILRESKNLSLAEVAGDYVSTAQLSRFENGKSRLSVDLFFACLKNMDVLQGEFSTFYSMYYQQEDIRTSVRLYTEMNNRNTHFIKQELSKLMKEYDRTGKKSTRVLAAVLHVFLNKCDKSYQIPAIEIEVITDYLFSIDEWCFYELWILGACYKVLSVQTLEVFIQEIVARTQFYMGIEVNRKKVYRILLNILGYLLDIGEEWQASKLIRLVQSLNILENDVFERLQLKFCRAHLAYLQGDKAALDTMKECQRFAEFLDCYYLSEAISETIQGLEKGKNSVDSR